MLSLRFVTNFRVMRELHAALVLEVENDTQRHFGGIGVTEGQLFSTNTDAGSTKLSVVRWGDGHGIFAVEDDVVFATVEDLIVDDGIRLSNPRNGGSGFHGVGARRAARFHFDKDVDECCARNEFAHEFAFFGGWVER